MSRPNQLSAGAESKLSRRNLLRGTIAGAAAIASANVSPVVADDKAKTIDQPFKIRNRRIRQSVMGWCFKPLPTRELLKHCAEIGLEGVEGISSDDYDFATSLGLNVSLVGSHGFKNGPVSRDNHAKCIEKLKHGIDLAVKYDCQNVITFTGMSVKGMNDATADRNCIDCWKQVLDYADEKGKNLCLEHLNSRDDTHPMKGHPGYYGDDVDHCIDLIRKVDSPRMKLLFDIYHVQVMNGDVIRRIRNYKDYIGHYHTAGNPGRCEIDEKQEINYPAVMRAIVATGFKGYVAQEFIPTWEDKVDALRHAAEVCDV